MSDWMSRFRELTKCAERLNPGDEGDDSDNGSTESGSSRSDKCGPKAIVPIVPFVTGGRGGERVKTPPNAEIEATPVSDGVKHEHFDLQLRPSEKCHRTSKPATPGDNRDNSDNSPPCYLDFETRNTGG